VFRNGQCDGAGTFDRTVAFDGQLVLNNAVEGLLKRRRSRLTGHERP
jgi:hypothetical protein